jgi:hypothetical protein
MAQLPIRSLRLRSYATSDLDRLTGDKGEIFYDSQLQTLKIYNGAGIAASTVTVGPADRLVNGARSVVLAANGALTISGDIRSDSNINIEINLADSTLQRWSFGEDGSLTFPDGTTQTTAWLGAGQPVFTSLIDSLDSSAITVTPSAIFSSDVTVENELKVKTLVNDQSKWQFGTDGTTTFPIGVSIDSSVSPLYPKIIADSGKSFSVQGQGLSGSAALSWTVDPDAAGQYAAVAVTRAGGGNLATVVLQAQSDSGDVGTVKLWRFDETGTLTLPAGGVIEDSASYIKLTPAGGANAYQALLIYPTAGDGNHIHLAAPYGGGTELYLGNDLHYVKLATSGNVEVLANDGVNIAGWIFGTDGALTIPGDIRSEGNINIEINLADSTRRIWQFGEDGNLTFPDGGNLRVSAVPATSIGLAGDTAGMLAFNASYAYYCTANYDGVTNIWRRTAHDVATW